MNITTIILVAVGALVLWAIYVFNRLVLLRNRAKEASSDIEVQQKRRYNLIPNLVETVKGYMTHESGVFEKVTEARTRAMNATGAKEKTGAENMLSGTLKTLFAVSENYPELKANANFLELQRELSDTENKIQASRRFYNTTVMSLNTRIESFPTNTVAGMLGFSKMDFFATEDEAKSPVAVKF